VQTPQLSSPPARERERLHKVSMHNIAEEAGAGRKDPCHHPAHRCETGMGPSSHTLAAASPPGAGEDDASGVGRTISNNVNNRGAGGGGRHHPLLLNTVQQRSSSHPPSQRTIPKTPDPQARRRKPSFPSAQLHLRPPPPDGGSASRACYINNNQRHHGVDGSYVEEKDAIGQRLTAARA
jgi:hypothetical protein